jgi:hypothetical protein
VLSRPYFDGEGNYDVVNVSYWPSFQTLEAAKQEADLNDVLLDDAPAT